MEPSPCHPSRPGSRPGFALISVLALVSLAALTATAFLSSARLESRANMSLQNSTRLEMALHAGSVAATELLDNGHGDRLTFVTTYWRGTGPNDWTNELGYLLNGYAPNDSTNTGFRFFACFSTATFTNLGNSFSALVSVSNNITNQGMFLQEMGDFMKTMTNFASGQSVNIPLLGDTPTNRYTSPPVGWVYIRQDVRTKPGVTNTTNIPVVRFAFYVQDLGGLIDAQRNGATNARDTGTNPEEISLSNAAGSSLTIAGKASNLVADTNRWRYLSPGMLTLSNAGGLSTNDLRYVTTGMLQWNAAWRITPAGLGYSNSTNPKFNINSIIQTNTAHLAVSNLATIITNNLGQFSSRGGGMANGAYISNIAANIVDYVDTNSILTMDSNNPTPVWRGVEAIPWPNEVYTRFNLANRATNPPNYEFQLGVKQYIEVWNLSSTPVEVIGSNYSISNNLDIPLKCTNWNGNLKSADAANPPSFETCTNPSFTLPPNSYGVVSAQTRTFKILVPTNLAPGTTTPMLTINPSTTNNRYTITYQGTNNTNTIDTTQSGRWLGSATNMKVGDFHFITTAVNFGTSANGTAYNLAVGDPRGSLFIRQPAMDFPYNQTTPGGRNSHLSSSGGAKIVDPAVNWVDSGHSSLADIVTSPNNANANNSIAQGLQKQGNPNHWIQKINNTGAFTNIMELGNIFDPIQWGDPNNPFFPLDTAAWMGLSNTATPFNGACGRTTLRIGRAEHARFAFTNLGTGGTPAPNMMMASAALLDLFCLTDTNSRYDEGGRINLNTAPAPVLRALAGGIQLTNDPVQKPTNLAIPPAMTEAFAQGVMRFRSKYPFLSPSQLAFIGTDALWPNTNTWPTNAVFGNTNTISLSAAPGNSFGSSAKLNITEWNDQAAEEWFSKIYNLAAVQSRNYRCYVIAQLVDEKGNPTGPVSKKYYHIFARNNALNPGEDFSASSYNIYEAPY